jgi:TatD DNase family protein
MHPPSPQVRSIPFDRLLLESDSPDGQPRLSAAWLEALPSLHSLPQQMEAFCTTNRPASLRCMLRVVSEMLGRGEAEVAAQTWANAERAFMQVSGDAP